MKHSLLTLSVLSLVFLAACTPANPPVARDTGTQKSSANSEQRSSEGAMMNESGLAGFAMEGGKMRIVREGDVEETVMIEDVQLKSGMAVMMDGRVKMADGRIVMLKEGDAVMMDGTVKTVEDLELQMERKEAIKQDEGAMIKKEETKEGAAMKSNGEYIDHTASNLPVSVLTDGQTKVLYFFASWCPTCKKANQTLTSWYADGKGMLTVYKINYDEEKTLEQKYGVTYQHTFVKVDGQGNMIEKIQGPSDEELKRLLQS